MRDEKEKEKEREKEKVDGENVPEGVHRLSTMSLASRNASR